MTRRQLRRRNFLLGAGGVTMGLPLLELFGSGQARAAAGDGCPRRFIAVSHEQGTVRSEWMPTGSETDFEFGELLAPCEPYKDRMVVAAGVDNRAAALNVRADGHGSGNGTLFNCEAFDENLDDAGELRMTGQVEAGAHGAATIDQVLAGRIGTTTPFTSIDLAIGDYGDTPSQNQTTASMKFAVRRGERAEAIIDPRLTYSYLFSDPGLTDPAAIERLLARRLSVLDAVHENFGALRARLGAADRERLDSHAEKVRQVEQRLHNLPDCSSAQPMLPAGYDHIRDDNISAPAQIDLLVLAMACGLANVGTINFTDGHGPTFGWIDDPNPLVPPVPDGYDGDPAENPPATGYTEWHDMVHRGLNQSDEEIAMGRTTEPGLIAGMRFYSETFAYLLRRLAETFEGDGTPMLDSTLVLWLSEFGNGGWHSPLKLPTVLAGNLGPNVAMGRFLDWESPGDYVEGQYCTNQLFTSVLNAFGFEDESFGRVGSYHIPYEFGPVDVELLSGALPL